MTAVIKPYFASDDNADPYGYTFKCPGCLESHYIPTSHASKCHWTFNGSLTSPTFSPSILCHEVKWPDGSIGFRRCHFFVRDGRIEFCGDSDHELAGRTVDMQVVQ